MTSTDTTPHRAVVVLSRALDQAGDVLEDVHPDDLSRSTPCARTSSPPRATVKKVSSEPWWRSQT